MARLIVWNVITLDGLFEGREKWDLEWHNAVWGDELEELSLTQLRSAGMLIFGRVTYEGMARYWQTAAGEVAQLMNAMPKIVFSSTLGSADWNNTRLIKTPAANEVSKLKARPGKDMLIFGSADLTSSLLRAGLIDEFRFCLTPLVLGAGTPFFKPAEEKVTMRLIEARALQSGGVILRYEGIKNESRQG